MQTIAVTTTPVSSICQECGIMHKSGKLSCCGRGGSWYGQCRRAGDENLGKTWYEGVRICKALQVQVPHGVVVGQQLYDVRPEPNASFDDAITGAESEANPVIMEAMGSASGDVSMTNVSHKSASTSFTARGGGQLLHVVARISLTLILLSR